MMLSIEEHILDGTPADVIARYKELPALASRSDFGSLDRSVVVIDTETTGLSFNHDELIQIAAARLECGKITEWFVTFVNPGQSLSDDIVYLTGIHDEDLVDAPSPQHALEQLVEFAGNTTMVAHNVDFDRTFVTRHPEGYPLLENRWIDTLHLSRIALPRLKSHRLIDLVKAFGAPVSTHRADDDVAATCVIYRILLAAVSAMPASLLRTIANMAPLEEWSTGFVFKELSKGEVDNPTGGEDAEAPLFSLRTMRQSRIGNLQTRPVRKDADDLIGKLEFPGRDAIEDAFTAEGLLGKIYSDYESRDEQRIMATAINDAFAAGESLVVEAGTGVGKSMAYLLPAALTARANGITIGVATKTNSLLDQLVYQELPSLAEAFGNTMDGSGEGEPLTWAPLKGISHYPCLRKLNRLVEDGPGMREVAGAEVSQAPALAALLSYVEQSEYSDIDSLKIDYRALPRYLFTTNSNECLRRKCPFFNKLCFVHGARRRAELADIVVTNHTLLFCDVAADGGLLPPIRYWIVDEAHSTEAEARSAFAATLDSEELSRLADRVGATAGSRNVFTRVERALSSADTEQLTVFFALNAKAKQAGERFAAVVHDYLPRVKDLLFFDPSASRSARRRGPTYDHVDVWINGEVRGSQKFLDIAASANDLVEVTDKLIKAAQDLVGYLEGIDEAAVAQREVASLAYDLRSVRNAAELIFATAPESHAYQATVYRKKDRYNDRVQALLLDVGEKMNETFYARTHSVVYASATLSVGGTFKSFEQAVGINQGEFSQASELLLDSSFDFDNNMIVYVVKDMPEPGKATYPQALHRLLTSTHLAQRGSMLTLFTNRREMENAFAEVNPQLKAEGLRLVCQRYGVSVKGLRDDFLADEHLSLFALKSFWEGFDAPGATLRGVIIPKLPFARPTDPLYCERASRDERAWWKYVLPQAVIETKQAAGRLIRKADDHGVLILADSRLLTKHYRKTFLESLQSRTVRVATIDEIARALQMMSSAGE